LVTALRARLPQHRVTALIFVGQAVAISMLLFANGTGPVATGLLVAFVVLFGLGFGLEALLRGTLVPEYYGPANYPRINGVLGAFVVGARAVGPLLAGITASAFGGYEWVFVAGALLCGASALTLLLANRSRSEEISNTALG
jgi:MFS family permease